MRVLNWTVMFLLFLQIVILISVRFSKQPDVANLVSTGYAASTAASSVPVPVSLHSFTALAKREGSAVVNVGMTQKIDIETFTFSGFPGIQPDDPYLDR